MITEERINAIEKELVRLNSQCTSDYQLLGKSTSELQQRYGFLIEENKNLRQELQRLQLDFEKLRKQIKESKCQTK